VSAVGHEVVLVSHWSVAWPGALDQLVASEVVIAPPSAARMVGDVMLPQAPVKPLAEAVALWAAG
jgi:hypothetical protein